MLPDCREVDLVNHAFNPHRLHAGAPCLLSRPSHRSMELIQLRRELDQKARITGRTLATRWETELRQTSPVDTGLMRSKTIVREEVNSGFGGRVNSIKVVARIDTDYAEMVSSGTRPHVIRARRARPPLPVAWPHCLLQTSQPSRHPSEPVVHRFGTAPAAAGPRDMEPVVNDLALLLAGDIETYLDDVTCEVDKVGVTFGEPADPTGTRCRQIFVWVQAMSPRETQDQQCLIFSRLTLAYRITSCYDVQEKDLTVVQHEAAADCLYEIGAAVWCGLVTGQGNRVAHGVGL